MQSDSNADPRPRSGKSALVREATRHHLTHWIQKHMPQMQLRVRKPLPHWWYASLLKGCELQADAEVSLLNIPDGSLRI